MKKNILITGASSGIGFITARYLEDQGHRVIGTCRNPPEPSIGINLLKMDITDDISVKKACNEAIEQLGNIDVLINNAGYGIYGSVEEMPMEQTLKQLNTNYLGTVRVTRELLPHFRQNGGGTILNISSIGGLMGLPFQSQYSAGKFALEGFTEALRFEVRPFGIRVCNINPGDFHTGFTKNRQIFQQENSVYKSAFNHFLKMYEHDENNGCEPILVAKLAEKIISSDREPAIRYTVGKKEQTLSLIMKRILGDRLFEKILVRFWKA